MSVDDHRFVPMDYMNHGIGHEILPLSFGELGNREKSSGHVAMWVQDWFGYRID